MGDFRAEFEKTKYIENRSLQTWMPWSLSTGYQDEYLAWKRNAGKLRHQIIFRPQLLKGWLALSKLSTTNAWWMFLPHLGQLLKVWIVLLSWLPTPEVLPKPLGTSEWWIAKIYIQCCLLFGQLGSCVNGRGNILPKGNRGAFCFCLGSGGVPIVSAALFCHRNKDKLWAPCQFFFFFFFSGQLFLNIPSYWMFFSYLFFR